MQLRTPIIPTHQTFAKVAAPHELHLEAICVFAAIGFFLDTDSYWKDQNVLAPASIHTLDAQGNLVRSAPWFQWHYTPRAISFNQALDEFTDLFETIIKEQTQNKKVILPLSGGLDSRTQAAALKALDAEVASYSYQFKNGFDETSIAAKIARACHFDFEAFRIAPGYLWEHLDSLYRLNKGYSDFTAPRQMAVIDQLANKGAIFSLGHWGDVLFDSMNLPPLTKAQELDLMQSKLLKRGGLELASKLWDSWGLEGDFKSYFKYRIETLLEAIKIEETNAKLRAFKSLYWASRWTSVNLSVFEAVRPISLPYYDDRMCQFICTVPEAYLKNRQLQIAYIQTRAPKLAKITWQDQHPFNLNNFQYNKAPYHLPYKMANKIKREFQSLIGQPYIQRNWELQFLGAANQKEVKQLLLESGLTAWIPKSLIFDYYTQFYHQDPLQQAHAINILLVLSKFNQSNTHGYTH